MSKTFKYSKGKLEPINKKSIQNSDTVLLLRYAGFILLLSLMMWKQPDNMAMWTGIITGVLFPLHHVYGNFVKN